VTVEEFDELTMSNITHFAKDDGRREPQGDRQTIVEFVGEVVSVELLRSIRLVTGLIFEMIRDRPKGRGRRRS
jgi:hypothetical protein